MGKMKDIDEKTRYEDAFFAIGRCAEEFFLFSCNIPQNLTKIVQNIYGRFDDAAYYVFDASNTFDIERKIAALNKAHEALFFQQSSLYLLIKSHGVTVGQANNVIDCIKEAYTQVNRGKEKAMKSRRTIGQGGMG